MSLPASRSRTVFRACVVNAVRAGEGLMQQLVKVTESELVEEESQVRNIQQRNLISDGLRLLRQHGAALVKGYPMALLEIFAEGPSASASKGRTVEDTGMDFGELSLMDESEVQAQVELSRAQQSALHATDAVLAELNTLVSSAQGLRSVQPERNPLRPESYIRALQQVVGETGVSPDVRQLWMQHMRELLGKLLAEEYRRTAASLREHGVQPVGYAVLGAQPGSSGRGGLGSGYGGTGYGSGYGAPGTGYGGPGYSGYSPSMPAAMSDYGRSGMGSAAGWGGDSQHQHAGMAPDAEEALLTVGILRQMLAGGDPFDPRSYGGAAVAMGGAPGHAMPVHAGQAVMVPVPAGHGPTAAAYHPMGAAAEAMEDIAQLERIVGRLSGGAAAPGMPSHAGSLQAPLGGWRAPSGLAPVVYAAMPMEAALQSPAMAVEVVGRMMANIAQDARLLPPVQKAVQSLEPALQQLVQHDARFFTENTHPARRLLDELTQRSLAFTAETAPGFSSFMRLLKGAVDHLATAEIRDAGPFDTVLKALQSAWDTQEQKLKAHQEAQQRAEQNAVQREMLAEKIAADIRKLPDVNAVPADILDFAAGPWADVVALAQVMKAPDVQDDDPGGYLALVPVLLWSAQPVLTRQEPERLNEAIPGLLAKLRKGLKTIGYPPAQTSALLQRLVGLHQEAFEKPVAAPAQPPEPAAESVADASEPAVAEGAAVETLPPEEAAAALVEAPTAPDPYADFVVGAWVELLTNGRTVRTQLTWASPHGTLFLFTAPDASTQSMTRRMRDKLAAEGALRVVPAPAARPSVADAELSRPGDIASLAGGKARPTTSRMGLLTRPADLPAGKPPRSTSPTKGR